MALRERVPVIYGRQFILYPHEVEAVRAFAKECGAELLVQDDASRCAQFVGDNEAFGKLFGHLYMPTGLIDEDLRLKLHIQEAGTLYD